MVFNFSFTPSPTDTPNTGAVRGARRLGTHDIIFLNLIQRMRHDVLFLSWASFGLL